MNDVRVIRKADGEWYWKKGKAKRVGPFISEYAATQDARKANGHDARRNYRRDK
jgi:hypothetical protein